jgi:hypothetical protein
MIRKSYNYLKLKSPDFFFIYALNRSQNFLEINAQHSWEVEPNGRCLGNETGVLMDGLI